VSQKKTFREMSALLQQEPGAAPGWEQRSRGGKTYWIRRDRFNPEGFFVAGVPYAQARDFVKKHHYSRSWALSVVNIGLYKDRPGRKPKLCGVAVFGMGPGAATLNKYFYDLRALELVRFVLAKEVKYYGETWFLRRAFAMLKQASWRGEGIEHYGGVYLGDQPLEGILAFSDPVPRTKLSGEEVMPGHVGHIYQAYGGLYSGRAGAHKDNILLPDGTVIDKRSQGKVSRQEQGAEGVYRRLVEVGARPKRRSETWPQWMAAVRFAKPFRRQIHPGTHAFVWKLGKPGFPQDYYYRSYRAPGTVEERRRLAGLIRQLQGMERTAPSSTSYWLQQEIEELKDRLRGMELVDPHSTPPNIMGYPRHVDIARVLGGKNRRARWRWWR
jgi:hypothetical protein